VITAYRVITTSCIVIPDFNPNNSQIYLEWVLGVDLEISCQFFLGQFFLRQLRKSHQSVFSTNSLYFEKNVRVAVDFQSQYEHQTVRTFQNIMNNSFLAFKNYRNYFMMKILLHKSSAKKVVYNCIHILKSVENCISFRPKTKMY
jgi:hypothetical protein